MKLSYRQFQLTRPVWGEPLLNGILTFFARNFNSLAPCGANPVADYFGIPAGIISTHSPRVGRTLLRTHAPRLGKISTHSPRVGRTFVETVNEISRNISTHSPRVGRTKLPLHRLWFTT